MDFGHISALLHSLLGCNSLLCRESEARVSQVCGMFYGIAVFLVMNLIVLPLSGLHHSSAYQLRALIQGILIHMFFIGVPIAFSLYKFSMSEGSSGEHASVTGG